MKYMVGIDEAGRGPLAGPVTLAAFVAPANMSRRLVEILGGEIKDSKRFSPTKRYFIYRKLLKLRRKEKVSFFVSHISNKIIDNKGINYATNMAIKKILTNMKRAPFVKATESKSVYNIRLDGSLKAPPEFKNQKTIIGGDDKDVFIACASIVAKVRRDRLMHFLVKKYPQYGFEIHKGYGTALHYSLIKKYGLSEIHRRSFCKNI